MNDLPDAYLTAVLRSVGVPEMWIEDGLQEMRIYFWRWGCGGKPSVHSAAVDAVRKYGARTKHHARIEYAPLEEASGMVVRTDFSGVMAGEFLAKLTDHQRTAVIRRMRGEKLTAGQQSCLFARVRPKWRAYAA